MTIEPTKAPFLPRESGVVRYGPELRVLIVGAGVAGLTLDALLRQRGFAPTVVERARAVGGSEYVIGLWPSASSILKGLGLFRRFEALGTECARCVVANDRGDILRSYSFASIAEKYGPLVNVFRSDLIAVLRHAAPQVPVRFDLSVRDLTQTSSGVVAGFTDGSTDRFDVVVACDGLRSAVRRIVFGDERLTYTGLTGWSFSLPSPVVAPHEVVEYLGANKFVSTYPIRDRVAVLLTQRAPENAPDPVEGRVERLREAFADFGGPVPWLLDGMGQADAVHHEDYYDLFVPGWHRDRVVLIGDAAHGSIPMNAMGAGLALESAAVLAEELCRADSAHVSTALERFEARRRPRVEHVQSQARRAGKIIAGGGGRFLAGLRNRGVQLSSDGLVLDEIDGMLAAGI